MEYNFEEIEKKWQKYWEENKIYKTEIDYSRPKYYVLDMFPYPSGAGLHVGHPLGYIATDIYSRYKRMKGFNVLHPMGFDAFGLPAEQYAIQTGQHPAITTEQNIKRYREQLDKIGFCFDWDREVQTCDPKYYLWTQWAFVKMFESYYSLPPTHSEGGGRGEVGVARPISELIEHFEKYGTKGVNAAQTEELNFTAEEWKSKTEKEKQEILMNYRLAYLSDVPVNWCPALGTVLANDEVINGVSERGGYPVEQKVMRQWCLRVSAYSQRLLDGLEKIDWSESLKEAQRNWIGRSEGAEMSFYLSPDPSPQERGEEADNMACQDRQRFHNTDWKNWGKLINSAKKMRSSQTEAENILWQEIRASKTGHKIRRQHIVDTFIVDFISLDKGVVIEIDGEIHESEKQRDYDDIRTQMLKDNGFEVIRFSNDEIFKNLSSVVQKIKFYLDKKPSKKWNNTAPLSCGEELGERSILVFTTRPDTIFGVTFMVLAPESEYVNMVTTPEQQAEVLAYLEATKRRTERERMIDKKVTGVFTGSYAINPFNGAQVPIWISDYVLAGYGTGAIMAVPGHDSRDHAFAKHFNLPIIPLIEGCDVSEESFDAKEGIMINSGFLNGLTVKEAIEKTKEYIKDNELGRIKVNYRLRDAIFSRQRYWGEPFPVYYKDDMPYMLPFDKLPLELPEVDKYLPTETGEPPLGRAKGWEYSDNSW